MSSGTGASKLPYTIAKDGDIRIPGLEAAQSTIAISKMNRLEEVMTNPHSWQESSAYYKNIDDKLSNEDIKLSNKDKDILDHYLNIKYDNNEKIKYARDQIMTNALNQNAVIRYEEEIKKL